MKKPMIKKELSMLHMHSSRPMDRLICGSRFWKTGSCNEGSVYMALNSKQTCILVPTTLPTSQHLDSFEQRFKDTGVNIASLSRDNSKRER